MTERSARFALPFILPGQAQKEHFHNEALAVIDALIHVAVEGEAATPPAEPEAGQCWIVAAGATGAWAGQDESLAFDSGAGWRFVAPAQGLAVWDKTTGFVRRWTGSGWDGGILSASALAIGGEQIVGPRQPDVPAPTGGAIVDAEARTAISALIVTLKTHGLID